MKTILIFILSFLGITTSVFGAIKSPEKLAHNFVLLLHQKEFHAAMPLFDVNMQKLLSANKLKVIWNNQIKSVGSFQKIIGTRLEFVGIYTAVFVTCQFKNKQVDVKTVFDKSNNIAGLLFLPTQNLKYHTPNYVNNKKFTEIDIEVGQDQWALPGTLSIPNSKGPFPSVILVHGSGAQDRDETIGPNKPFRDLAWGLSSNGIVVLRYEKRTKYYAKELSKNFANITVQEETILDVLKAVSLLQKNKFVKSESIFILGHSLGGMLIPRIELYKSKIAGFIIMAANARPLEDLILEQTLYQTSLRTNLSEQSKAAIEAVKKQVKIIKHLNNNSNPSLHLFGASTNYWLDLKGYRPAEVARNIKQPILIMQGDNDCQVSIKQDFQIWKHSLSVNKNVQFKSYPNLNHLFMEVLGAKSTGAEYHRPGNVYSKVVRDISDWITKHDK